jgi:hypothetical protein
MDAIYSRVKFLDMWSEQKSALQVAAARPLPSVTHIICTIAGVGGTTTN